MTATGIHRFGLALVIPLVLACLVFIGRVSADDALQPPEKPTGLEVSVNADTLDFTATWKELAQADRYIVRWRAGGSGFQSGNEVSVETNSATFTVQQPGEWVVRLEGCNAAGCGLGIAKMAAIKPGRPENLAVNTSPGALDITATWNETAGATSYKTRWRRPDGKFQEDNEAVVTANNASITVSDYGQWVVRVEGCNAAGCGRGIAQTFATTQPSPAKPENLVVVAQPEPMSFQATWDAAAGASNYKLRWRQPSEGFTAEDQIITTAAEANFTVSRAGEWIVRLDGCNDAGCSKAKNVRINVEPPPLAVPSVCDRTPPVRDKLVQITGRDCGSITADDLAGVTVLDLTNADITSLQNGDFNDLSGLQDLNLSYNDLTSLPEDVFDGLSNLEKLDLFYNMIASLPEDVFDGLSALEYLDLNCGRMTTLPEDVFDGLSNLQMLILSEGYLTTLPEDVFAGLSNLHTLYIGANRLTTLPEGVFANLSNLRLLEMGTNRLTTLPEGIFADLSSLDELDIYNNDLTALSEGVFAGLSNLEHLNLRRNELTELSEEVFDGLPSMWSLGLSGNPGYPFDLDLGDFVSIF